MPLQPRTVFVTLVNNPEDSLTQFYQQLFGQLPQVYIPRVYTEFQLPGLRLGIFQPKAERLSEFTASSGGGMSLCIEVDQLEAAIDHLTQLGYPPPGAIITASHGREIYAYDPAGNRLILHEPILLPK